MPKADLSKRFIAALIDGLIIAVPSLIPVVGALIGTLYALTKDALVYQLMGDENYRNRSIGKKIMNLEVARVDGVGNEDIDWGTSVKRNLPLAIGTLIMIIPVIGWVIGPIVGLVIGVIEVILVFTDPEGRRLGDKFAGTRVIMTEVKVETKAS
ncbi:MAG: RDD family protein [Bacillota bacterium]